MRLTAAHRRGALTPALPVPHEVLDKAGLRLRRGQVSLTVAAPGVGKSVFWLNLALRSGLPALYWSADTDAHDVLMRSMAMWAGHTMADVERARHFPDHAAKYMSLLEQGSPVEWIFDPVITPEGVRERLDGFAEVHGEYPRLFVIDNLANTVHDQDREAAEQKEVMSAMDRLAKVTQTHIAVLAHAKGVYEDGSKPIPQGGVLNNLAKVPSLMLTLHWADDTQRTVGLNITKNRGGRPDPGAKHPIHLSVDYARASVGGFGQVAT